MRAVASAQRTIAVLLVCAATSIAGGCLIAPHGGMPAPAADQSPPGHRKTQTVAYDAPLPRELDMVTMPDYVIESPDILRIRALRVIPKKPYRVGPLDSLLIQVTDVPEADRVNGVFVIEPDGVINLGPRLGGAFPILEMTDGTIANITVVLEKYIRDKAKFPDARVSVSLAQSRAMDVIQGQHLVEPDGKISLGSYGRISVVGMTIPQAKAAIEQELAKWMQDPEVIVDVAAFNSKVYYVIFDGGGLGQQMSILPITGNDTVLRAISQMGGLTPVSSKHRMWIARPAPADMDRELILPIDWNGIVMKGRTKTNYQLLPGDRLYVKANPLITVNSYLSQFISPIERIFGFTLLGNATLRAVDGQDATGGGF